jgi:hypothetical protein
MYRDRRDTAVRGMAASHRRKRRRCGSSISTLRTVGCAASVRSDSAKSAAGCWSAPTHLAPRLEMPMAETSNEREERLEQGDLYEADDDRRSCPKCGNDLEWVECWMIDCEEGTYDLYEEDPIYYSPGERASCSGCGGAGGWLVCANCESQSPPPQPAEPK